MSYMDQTMTCTVCGQEHSQFSTGICFICERKAQEAQRKAEWDAKSSVEQALFHLESWANPQHMTFNRYDAKFVLATFRAALAGQAAPQESSKVFEDAITYGTGFMKDGKHVPYDEVMVPAPAVAVDALVLTDDWMESNVPDVLRIGHREADAIRLLCARAERDVRKALAAQPAPAPAGEPVAWFESEESARNRPIKEVMHGMLHTGIWHFSQPQTSNPVWTLHAPVANAGQAQASAFPERDTSKTAEQQGMFRKFDVRRVDGSDAPGGKHHGCRYFVLDLDHDVHAQAAMTAYGISCAETHPELSADILEGDSTQAVQPVQSHDEDAAVRLRAICDRLGIGSHVPQDNLTLWGAAFAVLGQVRAALDARDKQAAQPAGDEQPRQRMFLDELDAAQAGEQWIQQFAKFANRCDYTSDVGSKAPPVKWCAYFDVHDKLVAAYILTRDLKNWTQLTTVDARAAIAAQQPAQSGKFKLGDHVRKTKGSQWTGHVVGTYSTALTPEGYAVESSTERGSVQIYPAAALELMQEGGAE